MIDGVGGAAEDFGELFFRELGLVHVYFPASSTRRAAADRADPQNAPRDDIRGTARSGKPDVGAYELGDARKALTRGGARPPRAL